MAAKIKWTPELDAGRWMTDGEIVRSWREAKKPDKQIKILAELNAVRVDKILKIIMEEENMANRINWTPELDAEVEQLRADGWAWDKIGERIGCSGKAAGIRYYKRRKPVHTPNPEPAAVETPAADLSPKPELPKQMTDEDYPGLLRLWAELLFGDTYKSDKTADTARTLMCGAAARYDKLLTRKTAAPETASEPTNYALYGIYDDLDLHAGHIGALVGLLQLVHSDAESGAERYDALMDRLAVLLDMLAAASETLDAVSERLGDVIKNQPRSGNSTADNEK